MPNQVAKHLRNKIVSYSIVGNGVSSCSGGCKYCSAAAAMNYHMWLKKNDIYQELKRIDDRNYEEFRADFNKLEETLDNDIKNVKGIKDFKGVIFKADLWMGDPVTAFQCLQEVVAFLEDYCQKREMICQLHTSTNGMPLMRDEICNYLKEHNVHVQLSHDGCGQHIRTEDVDPLDIPNVRMMIREGYLDWINCTLTFWNWSLFDNIKYFNGKLKEIFPEVWDENQMCSKELDYIYRHLFIKLNHIYDSDYDIKALNKYGRYRDKTYESLKTVKYGNLAFRNDWDLAKETGIDELAHVLDNYLNEWLWFATHKISNNNHWYLPYLSYINGQLNGQRVKDMTDKGDRKHLHAACHAFQLNKNFDSKLGRDTTFVIDTTGRYSECNLIDADHHVLNPTVQQPEYCKSCRYRNTPECLRCGSVKFPSKCDYQYRWNQLLEFVSKLK